ncbi:MAG: DUF3592 domain-containing protein [Luteolibacter sp.]
MKFAFVPPPIRVHGLRVQHTQASPRSGGIFLLILGLMLAAIGGVFVWAMAASAIHAMETRNWPQVPCVILVSEIEERLHDPQSPVEFRHQVVFGYEWEGKRHTSERASLRGNPWSSKRDVVLARSAKYVAGDDAVCFVNPADSTFAVLEPDSMAPLYSIWFPGLFVLGGVVMSARAVIKLCSA